MKKGSEVFPALTGVRFVAASMVFLFHYADTMFAGTERPLGYFLLREFNVGVSLFFVLSGFLITYRYRAFAASSRLLSTYFVKRFARIFPLYWGVLAVHFAYNAFRNNVHLDVTTVLLNITLLHGFSERYVFSGLTQSWSLAVEETFYLYVPFCFALLRFRSFFWGQVPLLFAVGFLLVGLSSFMKNDFFGSTAYLFSFTFFGRCFEFFVGVFLAFRLMKQTNQRKGKAFTAMGVALFLLLLLMLAAFAKHYKAKGAFDFPIGILFFNFLLPLAIGIFYYGLLTEETLAKKILSSKLVELLGKSSYAFYLLHVSVLAELFYFHLSSNLFFLYLFLQVMSILAYKLWEKPVYFFLLRRLATTSERKWPKSREEK